MDNALDTRVETVEGSTSTRAVGPQLLDAPGPQFLDAEQAEALIEQAHEQGVELEEGVLLRQMTKGVLERALAEELHRPYRRMRPATRPGAGPETVTTDTRPCAAD